MQFILRFAALVFWFAAASAWGALPDPVNFGIAIENNDVVTVKAWLAEGLDPNFMADHTGTGLMVAAWEGNVPMMELFVQHGADIHKTNRHQEQALQLAAWRGHKEAVEWLLAHGATINRSSKEWGALHYAVFAGHEEIARLLLTRGADINARTPNNSTALMMAAREGHEDLARVLLEAGADAKVTNEWGDNATTWAMRNGNYSIAKLVASPEEFAKAAKAPPESFGAAVRSVPAPAEVSEMLRQIRIAQAQGKPVEEVARLRKALFEAVARFKQGASVLPLSDKRGNSKPRGAPKALVITGDKRKPGAERVELIYEEKRKAPQGAAKSDDVTDILQQMQAARAKGQSLDKLRRQLYEAVDNFKRDGAGKTAAP